MTYNNVKLRSYKNLYGKIIKGQWKVKLLIYGFILTSF